jgi:hypothetical protein
VYVAGIEGNGTQDVAKYWKNGVSVDLTDGTQRGFANSIYVSGTDVYVAGGEQASLSTSVAKYWKNGVPVVLPDLGQGALARSIFVSGNNVYVAGWRTKTVQIDPTHTWTGPVATYWKNGVATELTAGTAGSAANSVFVVGTDVFVAGHSSQSFPAPALATYWKNGVQVQLTNIAQTGGSSIFVSGSDIYVAQNQDSGVAQVWKNGAPIQLGNGSSAIAANQVLVTGADILVAGAAVDNNGRPQAAYWKNGTPVLLGAGINGSEALGIAIGN